MRTAVCTETACALVLCGGPPVGALQSGRREAKRTVELAAKSRVQLWQQERDETGQSIRPCPLTGQVGQGRQGLGELVPAAQQARSALLCPASKRRTAGTHRCRSCREASETGLGTSTTFEESEAAAEAAVAAPTAESTFSPRRSFSG